MSSFHKTTICATLLALALPANALANATVTRDVSGVVTITSTANESNDILVEDQGGTLFVLEKSGTVAGLDPGAGCSTETPTSVSCGTTGTATRIGANLGPGADTFEPASPGANAIAETLNGENGNDHLSANAGDDILDGGAGDDVLDGGAGTDWIVYDRAANASVSAVLPSTGTTTGNGDTTGENDTLTSTDENLQGGVERDDFRGNETDNVFIGNGGDDFLEGMGGNDDLQGADGNDSLTGGAGTDTFAGGPGDDVLDARDEVAESSIECDVGSADKLRADNALDNVDKASNHCETLAPQLTSGTGTIAGLSRDGQTLTAPQASYSGDAVATQDYVWFRCTAANTGCVAINNATMATYTLTAADVGAYIGVTESATNAAGGDSGFSNYVGPVDAKPADPVQQPQQPQTPQTPATPTPATPTPAMPTPATPTQQQPASPQPPTPKAAPTPTPTAATVSTGRPPATVVRGGTVLADTGLLVGCAAACQATVQATATQPGAHGKPVVIGKASLKLAAGKKAKVTFKLTRAGKALLRRKKKLRVKVRVVTRNAAGVKRTITKTITIRAPRAKKRH